MWVFDGEEWTQDNGAEQPSSSSRPETARQRVDEFVPELQVIEVEIVHTPRPATYIPLPLP